MCSCHTAALNVLSAMNRQDRALCFGNDPVNRSSVNMRSQPPCWLRSQHDQIDVPLISDFQNLLCRDSLLDEVVRLAPQCCFFWNKVA